MLRRALRRARLHLPAGSVGQEDADRPVHHVPGDGSAGRGSPDVAYTSLAYDAAVDEHFRRQEEDVTGVHELLRALRRETDASARRKSIEMVGDEAQRAADAWSRLQHLYGLFQAMENEDGEDDTCRSDGRGRRTRDQGLRSLLEDASAPDGVMLRELNALPNAMHSRAPPQGFTTEMFVSLGDALYAEMVKASASQQQHQRRIGREALEELGDALYVDAVTVVPVSAC